MTFLMSFQEPRETCLACRGSNLQYELDHENMRFDKCSECGFVFMNPMLDEESITSFYRAYKRTESYTRRAEKKMKRSRGRMRRLKKYAKGSKFLDVGCNAGFVVEAAREVGFDSFGIDLSESAIEYANETFSQNTFALMTVDKVREVFGEFDLVYCSEVIEHVMDPVEFAAGLADAMAPGGYLYLTTPDGGHWNKPKDLTKWGGFCPPEHSVYFTEKALRKVLEKNGLKIRKRFFNFKPGLKLLVQKQL